MNRCARLLAVALGCAFAALASAQPLTVSAAASLQVVMRELGVAYRAAHPGAEVAFNFGASGALLAQLAQGAPVDVFASADAETMDRAAQRRLIDTPSRADFAANALVLVSPRKHSAAFTSLADLSRPGVRRIALGTPASVPAGRYAQTALEGAGLWESLAPKLVFAENVRQSLQYVSRGEVDAAFVYRTDALASADTVRIDFIVPAAVRYAVARVAQGRNAADAARFIAFVRGRDAQALLARHGFMPP